MDRIQGDEVDATSHESPTNVTTKPSDPRFRDHGAHMVEPPELEGPPEQPIKKEEEELEEGEEGEEPLHARGPEEWAREPLLVQDEGELESLYSGNLTSEAVTFSPDPEKH